MAILDLFSKRNKPLPTRDVLVYDDLPTPLRIQIVHLWASSLGSGDDDTYYEPGFSAPIWDDLVRALTREMAVFQLGRGDNSFQKAVDWFLNGKPSLAHTLDIVELTFRTVDTRVRAHWWDLERRNSNITQEPDEAIAELNHRFLENGVGYQYAFGKIIKLDTTFQHAQIVKPALTVLANPAFKNAQDEFLRAHEAYREGRYSDSLNESLKSFESTLKIICHAKKWQYQPTDTASTLIKRVLDNGLVPASMQQQLTSLRTLLESGTPTARNKFSGHGQGVAAVVVPDYLSAYGINTAAANITLLVAAFEASK